MPGSSYNIHLYIPVPLIENETRSCVSFEKTSRHSILENIFELIFEFIRQQRLDIKCFYLIERMVCVYVKHVLSITATDRFPCYHIESIFIIVMINTGPIFSVSLPIPGYCRKKYLVYL